MATEYVNFDDFRKEAKKRAFKDKIKSKIQKGGEWVVQNKEMAMTAATVIIGGVTGISKFVTKRSNLNKQEKLKDLYCYDRSLGHYWKLRRELTNDEWLEIDQRKKNGERLSDILSELKVLK